MSFLASGVLFGVVVDKEKRAVFRAGDESGEIWRKIFGEGRLTASDILFSRITFASVGRKTGRRGERTSIFSFVVLLILFYGKTQFGFLFIRSADGAREFGVRANYESQLDARTIILKINPSAARSKAPNQPVRLNPVWQAAK